MAGHPGPDSRIETIPALPEQQPVLANLLELYAHDFSEFHGIVLGEDGSFGYKSLPLYWSDPGRYPFLVRIDGKLAGFALVKKGTEISGKENVWDVAEFFVLRGYRRRGFGTQIANEVCKRFPGAWEVRVMQANVSALRFWGHAISIFAGEVIHPVNVEKDCERWSLFSFESVVAIGKEKA